MIHLFIQRNNMQLYDISINIAASIIYSVLKKPLIPENDQQGVYIVQRGTPFPVDQHPYLLQEDPMVNMINKNHTVILGTG